MTVVAMMAADLLGVFASTADGATTVTIVPREQGDTGVGFAATLAIGADQTRLGLLDPGGQTVVNTATATGSSAVLRAGILTTVGVDRPIGHGDRLRIAAGPYEGLWSVTTMDEDVGGACTMQIKAEILHAIAAPGVRQET